MFERIKRLFRMERITIEEVYNAVGQGFITEEQFEDICGKDYHEYEYERGKNHDGDEAEPENE